MALSNWDTLAADEEGKPSNGALISPLGVVVDIYKNWIYVHDERAWAEGGSFVKPTVMQIEVGDVRYKDVSILARRGPQEGVYVVVVSDRKAMVGCGVYGYDGDTWVGVKPESVAWFADELRKEVQAGDSVLDEETLKKIDLLNTPRWNQGDVYLAKRLGVDVPMTGAGNAAEPIFTKLLPKPEP
jgi:hypothetical protein